MSKYDNFVEGDVVTTRSKAPPYEEDRYIPITCPHCNVQFVEIKESLLKTDKASKCLKHLRKCTEFKGKVPEKNARALVVTSNTSITTVTTTTTNADDELKSLRRDVEALKAKSCLYDSVLTSVLPSLPLPLEAPEQKAKITLCEAITKEYTFMPPDVNKQLQIKDYTIGLQQNIIESNKKTEQELRKELELKTEELEEKNEKLNQSEKTVKESCDNYKTALKKYERVRKERNDLFAKLKSITKGNKEPIDRVAKMSSTFMRQTPRSNTLMPDPVKDLRDFCMSMERRRLDAEKNIDNDDDNNDDAEE
jgi:hypothetical protein